MLDAELPFFAPVYSAVSDCGWAVQAASVTNKSGATNAPLDKK